jgi:hypothetical protein
VILLARHAPARTSGEAQEPYGFLAVAAEQGRLRYSGDDGRDGGVPFEVFEVGGVVEDVQMRVS